MGKRGPIESGEWRYSKADVPAAAVAVLLAAAMGLVGSPYLAYLQVTPVYSQAGSGVVAVVGKAVDWLAAIATIAFGWSLFWLALVAARATLRHRGETIAVGPEGITQRNRQGERMLRWGEVQRCEPGVLSRRIVGEAGEITLSAALPDYRQVVELARRKIPLSTPYQYGLAQAVFPTLIVLVCVMYAPISLGVGIPVVQDALDPHLSSPPPPEMRLAMAAMGLALVGGNILALLLCGGRLLAHLPREGEQVVLDSERIAVRKRESEQALRWEEVRRVHSGRAETTISGAHTRLTVSHTLADHRLAMEEIRRRLPSGVTVTSFTSEQEPERTPEGGSMHRYRLGDAVGSLVIVAVTAVGVLVIGPRLIAERSSIAVLITCFAPVLVVFGARLVRHLVRWGEVVVVDGEGITLRRRGKQVTVPWEQVARVHFGPGVVTVSGPAASITVAKTATGYAHLEQQLCVHRSPQWQVSVSRLGVAPAWARE